MKRSDVLILALLLAIIGFGVGVLMGATVQPVAATCVAGGPMGHNDQMFYRVWSDGRIERWHKHLGWERLEESETK